MRTGRLINIFLIVFIDMLGFGLILPLLPYYAGTFGATPLLIGLLVASFAAASLIGAPIMGRLSDRNGRRPILLLSVAGTFTGYLLLGLALPVGTLVAHAFGSQDVNSFIIAVLFLSRMIDGLTGGNITVAQAYICDITDERDRSRGLGLIGSAFGLGFIIGPAVGGFLSRWGYNMPAFAAASMALINLISIFLFLPESLNQDHQEATPDKHQPAVTLKALTKALNRPKVGPLLVVRFFLMMAFSMFMMVFAMFAQRRLNLSSQSTGFVLTYVGVYSLLVQGVAIGKLTKRFSDNSLILASLCLMFVGYLGWALTPNLIFMLITILPLAGGGWIANTIITSRISKAVAPQEIGGILGISTSVENITRVVSPTIGGLLFGSFGMWTLGVFSAIMVLIAVLLASRLLVQGKKREEVVRLPLEEACAEG